MIINMEYKHCTWNEHGISEFNYTFHSRLGMKKPYEECPTYLQEGGHKVGCRLPYATGDKYKTLSSKLSWGNSEMMKSEIKLEDRVKLNPPHNLSLHMQNSSQLWLYWNISARTTCVENLVSYRKDTDQKWTSHPPTLGNYFSLPFPSESNQYTFKVKTRVAETCLESMWSDWSTPVFWGPIKVPGSMDWKVWVSAVICCVVMVILVCLLVQNERLRIILIPIVPNVSKSLEELFYTYNGNVEEWLHISKEFVEGFKPNFSEPACSVREYNSVPQASISGSECSLPIPLDQSDYLYTSCSTFTSSISAPTENTSPGLV
ncbi:hypothetical protein AAFF_G00378060 [Aldrovandia affinis]|uniref:Fibronectin type-III domain-containing protein n=1 Tax=Aldrovandia affinis TaxID=143900 RepID=A0AAD7WM75_9TELE|nr:hypothetical protein AAFF_G00378060 [Aldrovandia affinis]